MWLLNVNILLILINLISALNKSDSHSPAQSLISHVHIAQNLKNPNLISQQADVVHPKSQLNQQSQFSQQHNHQLNKLNQQLSQQAQQTKEISCSSNQTINFIKYSNHKLSLNFLNKLTEFTIAKLLNQTIEKSRANLNSNRSITHLCYDACKNDLECLAFTVNLKQLTCYLVKEDFKVNKDHLLFDATSSWNFFEKVCFNKGK